MKNSFVVRNSFLHCCTSQHAHVDICGVFTIHNSMCLHCGAYPLHPATYDCYVLRDHGITIVNKYLQGLAISTFQVVLVPTIVGGKQMIVKIQTRVTWKEERENSQ